jgi:hypothetical protein
VEIERREEGDEEENERSTQERRNITEKGGNREIENLQRRIQCMRNKEGREMTNLEI